jgi:hypothetical protein
MESVYVKSAWMGSVYVGREFIQLCMCSSRGWMGRVCMWGEYLYNFIRVAWLAWLAWLDG